MKKKSLIVCVMMVLGIMKIDLVRAENVYKDYKIGDKITYNGMDFYVIEDSDRNKDYVTVLKETPLTENEVNKYGGVGTENNHVNVYSSLDQGAPWYQTSYGWNGCGGMSYFTSSSCGYDNGIYSEAGCKMGYEQSEVKYVVDAWAVDKLKDLDLKEDDLGYKVRLLTIDDLTKNLGYEKTDGMSYVDFNSKKTPSWVNAKFNYWTMSSYKDNSFEIWYVEDGGGL